VRSTDDKRELVCRILNERKEHLPYGPIAIVRGAQALRREGLDRGEAPCSSCNSRRILRRRKVYISITSWESLSTLTRSDQQYWSVLEPVLEKKYLQVPKVRVWRWLELTVKVEVIPAKIWMAASIISQSWLTGGRTPARLLQELVPNGR
jgi:hypothetical protein